MKTKNITGILFLAVLPFFFACKKWVFVEPKTEIREEAFFSSQQAFQEALNGVYASMGSPKMYGMNMTWGLVDAMGGMYFEGKLETQYQKAAQGQFDDALTEQMIIEIWSGCYTSIANINNLLQNLERSDANIFTGSDRQLLEGEALGLRALLHFDLLRLFGPVSGTGDWNKPLMPYVTVYGREVNPKISPAQVIERVLADLVKAEGLLANDPVKAGTYNAARKVRFNYYAAKALEARVYSWINDHPKALAAAETVINAASARFPWVSVASIVNEGNMIFSSELIFALYINNLKGQIEGKLDNIAFTGGFFADFVPHFGLNNDQMQEQFEAAGAGVTDYRNIYSLKELSGTGFFGNLVTTLVYKKLHQTGAAGIFGDVVFPDSVSRRLPVMRISEMHYIAAESKMLSDPAGAVSHLNTVREMRGITAPLSASLPADLIQQEIFKEYRKEFTNEGQVFFYRKRKGERPYQLNIPQREIELGK